MAKNIQAIRGMNDCSPTESPLWQWIEGQVRQILSSYGYSEVRMPIVESTPLFARAIGEVTDVVSKEMYTFWDNDEQLTLRPEGTAGCVRAAIEHGWIYNNEQRLWYMGPMFRHERPQKGRYRQFHQAGVEVFGIATPEIDAELIILTARLWKALGIDQHVSLQLNSIGSLEARANYRSALVAFLENHQDLMSEEEKERLVKNPLRILDTKNQALQDVLDGAPKLLDYLDDESREHFAQLCGLLDAVGIQYEINPKLVRGLDYYNKTVFEWVTSALGAQGTVCGGGRYDGLVEYFDGPATPAFGFGLGIERLLMIAQKQEINFIPEETLDVYIAVMGEKANLEATKLAESLREQAFKVERDFSNRKLGAQFKTAEKLGAELIITLGEDEIRTGQIKVKHNQTRKQVETTLKAVHESFAPIFEEIYADEEL